MEYVGPPRGAMNLLKFFVSEPDFDTVIGDLSEEFQQQVSALGQAAARRWYWHETVRNASAFAKRGLLRTPVTVLLIAVLIFVGLWLAIFFGGALLFYIRRAWIPIRFWRWYQFVVDLFFPTAMISSAGVLASRFLKARELSLIVAFATVLTCAEPLRAMRSNSRLDTGKTYHGHHRTAGDRAIPRVLVFRGPYLFTLKNVVAYKNGFVELSYSAPAA